MRPRSILLFERLYWVGIAISIVSAVWSYFNITRLMPMLPPGAPAGVAAMVPVMVAGSAAVGILIKLLLWYFAARRASNGARWILVILFALALIGIVRSLFASAVRLAGPSIMMAVVVVVLEGACVWLLFRPDADLWFRGRPPADPDDTLR